MENKTIYSILRKSKETGEFLISPVSQYYDLEMAKSVCAELALDQRHNELYEHFIARLI